MKPAHALGPLDGRRKMYDALIRRVWGEAMKRASIWNSQIKRQ
jgi:hypothetical protein